ncbi:hypothetical protein [Symbiopectobacterium sp. RP]|uniref:hypothetical protein n=1 Tax=Symbiopectobacterium sp. RP TaxID=3248553 RepID=UPI003D2718B8
MSYSIDFRGKVISTREEEGLSIREELCSFLVYGVSGRGRILLIDFVDDFNNREMIPHEKVYPTGLRRTKYCR